MGHPDFIWEPEEDPPPTEFVSGVLTQGLKPSLAATPCGTAEAVPFVQIRLSETWFGQTCQSIAEA
jgi:hypothetical protein